MSKEKALALASKVGVKPLPMEGHCWIGDLCFNPDELAQFYAEARAEALKDAIAECEKVQSAIKHDHSIADTWRRGYKHGKLQCIEVIEKLKEPQ
jgi:hypothetical protein